MKIILRYFLIMPVLLLLCSCIPGAVDGYADGNAFVWFDENADGVLGSNEKPMARVLVGIQYPNYFTDKSGNAKVYEFVPGCGHKCWKGLSIYIQVPDGYELTTQRVIPLTGNGKSYQFGLTLGSTGSTPTPYLPHMVCKTYPEITEAVDVAVAPNGIVWLGLYDGLAQYNSENDQFIIHKGPEVVYEEIYLAENEVWIASSFEIKNRYSNSEWLSVGEDNLITESNISIGETPDGRKWFIWQSFISGLLSFDPRNAKMEYFTATEKFKYLIGEKVRVFTDGSEWFAAFIGNSDTPFPPANPKIKWQFFDITTLTSNHIRPIPDLGLLADGQIDADGTIWLATSEGLVEFNPINGNWQVHKWPHNETLSPIIDYRNRMAISKDGSIWIGTSSFNTPLILRYFPKNNSEVWATYDERDGIPNTVSSIAISSDDSIWIVGKYLDTVTKCTLIQ